MSSSALVLFSGGQDSTVCLAWALARFSRVETVGFDYGQRHVRELADRRHRRQALPLHQHAPGHRGDLRRLGLGPRRDQLAPLALDDRGEPR